MAGARSLYITLTEEFSQIPLDKDFDYKTIPLLEMKGYCQTSQEAHVSLDWRLARGVAYINKYKARYEVPHRFYHINEEIAALTLDRVFGHYTETLTTPVLPEPKEEEEEDE